MGDHVHIGHVPSLPSTLPPGKPEVPVGCGQARRHSHPFPREMEKQHYNLCLVKGHLPWDVQTSREEKLRQVSRRDTAHCLWPLPGLR